MTPVVLNIIKPADVGVPPEIKTFAVVQRNEANKCGKFAKRISPLRAFIKRFYYGSGNYAFQKTKKNNQKNYDDAISLCINEFETKFKQKIKGKSAYNLAVVYDIKGDYKNAFFWAQKAM